MKVAISLRVTRLTPISPMPRTLGRSRNCGISSRTCRASSLSSPSLGLRHSQQWCWKPCEREDRCTSWLHLSSVVIERTERTFAIQLHQRFSGRVAEDHLDVVDATRGTCTKCLEGLPHGQHPEVIFGIAVNRAIHAIQEGRYIEHFGSHLHEIRIDELLLC